MRKSSGYVHSLVTCVCELSDVDESVIGESVATVASATMSAKQLFKTLC